MSEDRLALSIHEVQHLVVLASAFKPDVRRTDPSLLATLYKVKAYIGENDGMIRVPGITVTDR